MRRDVYIENDSGGFSVLAADAVADIIEDQRADDFRFVTSHKVMLLELYGDDSLPVRIVVDEPLRADEEEQWLARASWRIDTTDGQLLVMGGFDPDVLSWWKEGSNGHVDGRGVGAFTAEPGSWQVDIYAHVGSMNGRHILDESDQRPGAAFRRSHPGRPFPLWLAHMLEFSGDDDPGFEAHWRDVRASIRAGQLAVDTDGAHAIGFLVHVTRFSNAVEDPPESGWFELDRNRRVPALFPIGLASEVTDPELQSFNDRLLDRRAPEPERPSADRVVEIIEVWPGDALQPVAGGPAALDPQELFLLHWMAGLTADATPRFELWVEANGPWTAPAATPDFAVVSKTNSVIAIGPVHNTGGWHTWWTSRNVAEALTDIPDGSTIDLAMARRQDDGSLADSAVGRARYRGKTSGGAWHIESASPQIARDTLEQALAFTRDLVGHSRLHVHGPAERAAFAAAAGMYLLPNESVQWDGDLVRLTDPEERTLLMLAAPVFRTRFGHQWPVDVEEPDDDEADDDDDD
jgi:hypothetical protein